MKQSSIVVTLEDASIKCGLGSEIEQLAWVYKLNCEILKMGYPDEFVKHGSCTQIEQKYNLDDESILRQIMTIKQELESVKSRGKGCLRIIEKANLSKKR